MMPLKSISGHSMRDIYLSICLTIFRLFIYLSVYLPLYTYIYLSVCQYIFPFFPSSYVSITMFTFDSVHKCIHLFVCPYKLYLILSLHLSIFSIFLAFYLIIFLFSYISNLLFFYFYTFIL